MSDDLKPAHDPTTDADDLARIRSGELLGLPLAEAALDEGLRLRVAAVRGPDGEPAVLAAVDGWSDPAADSALGPLEPAALVELQAALALGLHQAKRRGYHVPAAEPLVLADRGRFALALAVVAGKVWAVLLAKGDAGLRLPAPDLPRLATALAVAEKRLAAAALQ